MIYSFIFGILNKQLWFLIEINEQQRFKRHIVFVVFSDRDKMYFFNNSDRSNVCCLSHRFENNKPSNFGASKNDKRENIKSD